MNSVTLYKNPYPYPYFGGITSYKNIQATPRNQNLRSGFIDMQLSFDEVLSFNYLSFTRNSRTLYAWVTDVEEKSGNKLYRVHYNIDPYRTYKNDLVYGNQYVERSPSPTLLYDPLLSSTKETNDITRVEYSLGNPNKRYAVVQRRPDPDESLLSTPIQPAPYKFYICEYDVNNWMNTAPIRNLVDALTSSGETKNIVTMYSVPFINLSGLSTTDLVVRYNDDSTKAIGGWKLVSNPENILSTFTTISIPKTLNKTKHSVMVVIPDSGIINVPSEFFGATGLGIRQDVDLYSGACNYILCVGDSNPYHLSVRGSSMSSIPILSDPYDTYISQNQNSLTSSIMGDVANLAVGGLNVMSGNIGGGASIGQGLSSLITKSASLKDAQSMSMSNPPAFLGTALATKFHQKFWVITISTHYDNESYVRENFGYPCERVQPLVPPSKGYIKTQNCNLSSNGCVPLWAIQDINQLFDNGILFK